MAARFSTVRRWAQCIRSLPRISCYDRNRLQSSCFHTSLGCFGDPLKLLMPALSPTMTQGTILKWHKKEGDTISPGDLLCDIQTDKAVVSHEVEEEGILAKILKPENSADVTIGTLIALMVDEGDDWQNVAVPADAEEPVAAAAAAAASAAPPGGSQIQHTDTHHAQEHGVGPSVRVLRDKYNIRLDDVTATGPRGILLKGDIISYVSSNNIQPLPPPQVPLPSKAAPAPSAAKPLITAARSPPAAAVPPVVEAIAVTDSYMDLPLSNMRRVIAKRLTESKTTIPHCYGAINCHMNQLLQLRKELADDGVKLSVNDFIVKAAAVTLKKVPEVNAIWSGESGHLLGNIDICIAVATDAGLITPIIKDAAELGVADISAKTKELAEKARAGKLMPEEFQGGSFTISNLGMYGITEFSAVINPPQACILAVGTSCIVLDVEGLPQTHMTVTLSADARIVDETLVARFLETFQEIIENPALMIGPGPSAGIQKLFAK